MLYMDQKLDLLQMEEKVENHLLQELTQCTEEMHQAQ